jgi:hypothetical protein
MFPPPSGALGLDLFLSPLVVHLCLAPGSSQVDFESRMEEQSFLCCLVISQSNLLFLLVFVSTPRFSQLLRFQLFFFLHNILVPHQVRPGSFIARARFFL